MMVIATHVVDDDALKQREMIYGIFHRPFEIITFSNFAGAEHP